MKLVTFLACLSLISALVVAVTEREYVTKFEEFKKRHKKKYHSDVHVMRFHRWKHIHSFIKQHNQGFKKGRTHFLLEDNHFADHHDGEWRRKLFGITLPEESSFKRGNLIHISNPNAKKNNARGNVNNRQKQPLVAPLDWRHHPCLPPIRNQYPCGACWAFVATTSVEFQTCLLKRNSTTPRLSEQQLIDCSRSYGTNGCDGGFYTLAWDYITASGGQASNFIYPYKAKTEACKFIKGNTSVIGKPVKNMFLTQYNEETILTALKKGPVSASISANMKFILYSSGIFDDDTCKDGNINHGVVIVGQGIINGTDVWIVRNSWGTSWGQNGYIYMKRGVNICKIAMYAFLATP